MKGRARQEVRARRAAAALALGVALACVAAVAPAGAAVAPAAAALAPAAAAVLSSSLSAPLGPPGALTPLTPATVATSGTEPVGVVVSPDGKNLYAAFERGNSVQQFSRDTETGAITALSPATIEAAAEPRTITISRDGRFLYAANFGSNSITTFARNLSTGALTVSGSAVASGSQPHGIEVSPDNRNVYVANYSAASVSQYTRNLETGALTPMSPATLEAGTHPNGIGISPDGKNVYSAMRGENTVGQYSRNTTTGALTVMSSPTIAAGQNPHDITVSPDGRNVYVPNAAESSKTKTLSQYSRNTETGRLTALSPATVETGGEARGVAISRDGTSVYVANGTEGVASQYSRSAEAGKLTALSPATAPAGAHSYFVAVSPDGHSAYVSNEKGASISQYSRASLALAPTAVSEAASAVGRTSATLNGSVNPNGGEVSECKLEYGTSVLYGSSVPCSPSPGSGSSAVAVSGAVAGLTAGTAYHFRVVATNAGGTSRGVDEAFTTLSSSPGVATEGASSVTQTGAVLEATVNPNGTEVTECKFEYGTSLPSSSSVPCSPSPGSGTVAVGVLGTVAGLAANSGYQYRVVAANAGVTSVGSARSFTTLPNSPGVVSEGASSVSQSGAVLEASVNPNGGNVSSCVLEYGTSASYGASVPCSPSPGSGTVAVAVSGAVGSLAANTTYHYRVAARNAGGTSLGADKTVVTLRPAPTAVTAPASGVGRTSATLNGSVNPNGGEVSECKLEYGTSGAPYGSSVPCSPSPGSGSSAVAVSGAVGSLTAGTTYHFRVVATNPGGTSRGADETLTTLPNAPVVITEGVSSVSQSGAVLEASVNPNGGSVSSCVLEYGTSGSYGASVPCNPSPGSGTVAVIVSGTVGGLATSTTYHYRVAATNGGGASPGADKTFTTTAGAPPEFGRCLKVPAEEEAGSAVYRGAFTSESCVEASPTHTGQYEWRPGVVKAGFTSAVKPGTTATLESVRKEKVTCSGETSTGAITGLKTVGNVVMKFTGCAESGGKKCTTAGRPEGELESKKLEGVLGVESVTVSEGKETRNVALDLYPRGKAGPFVEFTCAGSPLTTFTGALLAPVTSNKMLTTTPLNYAATGGKQTPEHFEGATKDVLIFKGLNEQVGLTLTSTQTNEEAIEINAVV